MKKFNLRNKQSIAKIVKDFETMLMENYEDAKDTEEALEIFHIDLFNSQARSDGKLHLARGESMQDLFTYFMDSFDIRYYDDEREYLKKLYQETDEEAEKFEDDQVNKQFRYLQYVAYKALCKKLNKKTFDEIYEIV